MKLDLLLFGWMTIGALFTCFGLGQLAWGRIKAEGWRSDPYFWLCAGIAVLAAGLAEFGVIRTYQALSTQATPFVQSRIAALTATATIVAGLSMILRAKALNDYRSGIAYLACLALWLAFTLLCGG